MPVGELASARDLLHTDQTEKAAALLRTTHKGLGAAAAVLFLAAAGVLVANGASAKGTAESFSGSVRAGGTAGPHVFSAGPGALTARLKCGNGAATLSVRITGPGSSQTVVAESSPASCNGGKLTASGRIPTSGDYRANVSESAGVGTDYKLKVEHKPPTTSGSTTSTSQPRSTTTTSRATTTSTSTSTSTTIQGNTTTTSRPPGGGCTGSGDETALVQAKINAVADGGTVNLSGTCRVPGELQIINRKGLTIAGPVTLDGSSMTAGDMRHLRLQGGERITLRNLTILGARGTCRTSCGSAGYDREHGIAVESFKGDPLTDVVIDDVTIRGVHGDFVYVGIKGSDAPADAPNRVTIKNSTFVNSGRQGISGAGAEDLTITRNHLEAAGRSLIDFEAEAGGVGKVTITDNDIYDYDNAVINIGCADRGTGVPLNRGPIGFSGNRIHGQRLKISTSCAEVSGPPVLVVGSNQENI